MRQQQMVHRSQRGGIIVQPWRMDTCCVPEERRAPRFVQGGPGRNPIAQGPGQCRCIVSKPGSRVAVQPATGILQFLWQIPVVERDERRDLVGE